jgi:hypothetical protein
MFLTGCQSIRNLDTVVTGNDEFAQNEVLSEKVMLGVLKGVTNIIF